MGRISNHTMALYPSYSKRMLSSRLALWVFRLYLLVIALRFSRTILQGLQHPFLPGADIAWLGAWLCLSAILALAYGFAPSRYVTRAWLAIYAAATIIMVTLSKTV